MITFVDWSSQYIPVAEGIPYAVPSGAPIPFKTMLLDTIFPIVFNEV